MFKTFAIIDTHPEGSDGVLFGPVCIEQIADACRERTSTFSHLEVGEVHEHIPGERGVKRIT